MTNIEIKQKIKELDGKDLQRELNLRGKLIKNLKAELKHLEDKNKKPYLEAELIKELEEHKKTILKLEKEQGKAISIPKKVGLKVKEIADTIEIFLKREDVVGKLKTAGISTAACTIFMAAIKIGFAGITGSLSLASLAAMFPSICYVALSNVIKMGFTNTEKSKIMKLMVDNEDILKKTTTFVKSNIVENKEFLNDLKNYKKLNTNDNNKKIEIIKKMINHYRNMIKSAPNEQIGSSLRLELVGVLNDLKKCLELKKKNYINDKEQVNFLELEKELATINAEIFTLSSNLKNVSIETGKNIGKSVTSMYVSRMLLSTIFPSLKFTNLTSALMPMLYTVVGNLATADKLKEKINVAKSNYVEQIIKFYNKDLANEIFGNLANNEIKTATI